MERRDFIKKSSLSLIGLPLLNTYFNNSNKIIEEFQLVKFNPITKEERLIRIAKAQRLLIENNIQALILDAGTSLDYFTGLKWYPSERSMLCIIPQNGHIQYICPAFEEDRFQELDKIGDQVSTWEEHENPFSLCFQILKKLGITKGQLAVEEQTRFFIADGLKKAGKNFQIISGDPITVPCRLIKSPHEIELMQLANNATLKAIEYAYTFLNEGVSTKFIADKIAYAHTQMGTVHDFAAVTFGLATSFPHGSNKKTPLKKGDVVMMDVGCRVGGYSSDITRTIVFGKATDKQKFIWELEQKAQLAGFKAAQLGVACEEVDFAARKVIIDAGFGPNYQLPGLPHRTGHGIGMNGHEWGNMVKGNKLPLQVGMCFSIEPTIAIPGEFGVRHEDCVYMTENGPNWFTEPSNVMNYEL
ncbi:M24 family metallopeptidase [Aquirufa sp. ROCK-SH2]